MAVAEHRPVVAEHVAEPENLEKKSQNGWKDKKK